MIFHTQRAAVARRRRKGGGILVFDSFNRADNALTLGNADTGQAWLALNGTPGVLGARAYFPTPGAANETSATVNAGTADCLISVIMAVQAATTRIVFRSTDVNNGFICDIGAALVEVYRLQAGVYNLLNNVAVGGVSGDAWSVRLQGQNIVVLKNGVGIGFPATTSAFNQGASRHGIGINDSAGAARFKNFQVASL